MVILFGWSAGLSTTRVRYLNNQSIDCIHGPQRMRPNDFSNHPTFPLATPAGGHLGFGVKCLKNIGWITVTFGAHTLDK